MLKLVVVIVLVAHGLGHTMALSSAFRPAGGFSRRHWTLSDGVAIYTPAGKALALVWLVPLAGFLAGAYGLSTGQEWWRPVLTISSVVSIVAVLPWWRVMPVPSYLGALLVDLLVLAALLTPWGGPLIQALGWTRRSAAPAGATSVRPCR
jgi:hypothetical protein